MTTQKNLQVGILTFHAGINHGGFLQAWALQECIQEMGHSPRLLNYFPVKHRFHEIRAFLVSKNIVQVGRNAQKIRSFRKALKTMPLDTQKIYSSKAKLIKSSMDCDFVILGSDTVWDWKRFGEKNLDVYFGRHLYPRRGVFSYAASMGTSGGLALPDWTFGLLSKMREISVRDTSSLISLSELSRFQGQITLDPTFLIADKIKKATKRRAKASGDKPFLLVYATSFNELDRIKVEEFCTKHDLRIVTVGYPQKIPSLNKTSSGIFEWLDLFQAAEFVVTSTYHGTIFSLIFNKKFVTLGHHKVEKRVIPLLELVGCRGRYLDGTGFSESAIIGEIDWETIRQRLRPEVEMSWAFLKGALGDI